MTEPGLDEAREAPGTKCKEALALSVMQVLTVPLQDAKSRCLLKFCALSVRLALARSATSATRARALPIPRDCENRQLVLVWDLRNAFFYINYERQDFKTFWHLHSLAPLLFQELAFLMSWHGSEKPFWNTSPSHPLSKQAALFIYRFSWMNHLQQEYSFTYPWETVQNNPFYSA